jgi:hypothetical protein
MSASYICAIPLLWYDDRMKIKERLVYLIVFAMAVLGVSLMFAPELVRALPGRYVSYLPEPIQALRRKEHPLTLPTPVAVSPLLPATPSPATPMPDPTGAPVATAIPPTATLMPEPAVTLTPEPTLPPTPTPVPAVLLEGLRHERQGWNNCGPTTLAMALSIWGRAETQFAIAPALKPDPEDKHVEIVGMADYVRSLGLDAIIRVGGSVEKIKALLRAGFPVIVESWYVRDAHDQLGHYRLVIGYDDSTQTFALYDPLYDPPTVIGYQQLDELWRVFNRMYLLTYPPERAGEVAAILGAEMDDAFMFEQALATAQAELDYAPETCAAYADCADWLTFSWFNIGTNLNGLGYPVEAAAAYDEARQRGLHYRMLWYQFGPYESYYAAGRYDDVITLADATLNTAKNLEQSYYWRGRARLALGDADGARSDFETALRYHRGWEPAVNALAQMDASP